jgi:lipoate-protein ligase A
MPPEWRLVDSGLVQPPESAALDEAILEAHTKGNAPNTLHFYRRSVPTISLGYFQKAADAVDLEECARRGVTLIRRKSGGSAIYTDSGQLIYGLVVSEDDLPGGRAESFRVICSAMAKAISAFGVDAKFRPPNDVEVGGRKVSGNAQLVRKGSVLQHGTVLVDTDVDNMAAVLRVDRSKSPSLAKASDRVATLSSILGRVPDMQAVKDNLVREIGLAFGTGFTSHSLTSEEKDLVRSLAEERYSCEDWNLRF